jgi:hypothetical protein
MVWCQSDCTWAVVQISPQMRWQDPHSRCSRCSHRMVIGCCIYHNFSKQDVCCPRLEKCRFPQAPDMQDIWAHSGIASILLALLLGGFSVGIRGRASQRRLIVGQGRGVLFNHVKASPHEFFPLPTFQWTGQDQFPKFGPERHSFVLASLPPSDGANYLIAKRHWSTQGYESG